MNKTFQCAVIFLSLGAAAVMPAAEPAPPAPPAPPAAPAAPTTAPGAASTKPPPTAPASQAAGSDRIESTEKVRADSEVSFPVDI